VSDLGIEIKRGIEYANHEGVSLLGDLYVPGAAGTYPALLLIHGGAWRLATRDLYQFWGPYFARHG
jgi:acetyl esterase/lipase